MSTLSPQQFFHFAQPAVCADCSTLAETAPRSLRHLSHTTAATLCAVEQSSSCPRPLRLNKATAKYKDPSTLFCLSMASPMAREGMRKDCRSHMVGNAQHCTAAKIFYHIRILGPQSHRGYVTLSLEQPQRPRVWDSSVPSA